MAKSLAAMVFRRLSPPEVSISARFLQRTYRRSHSIPLPEATQVSQACDSSQRDWGDRW
ncbi:hypothetical protein [Chroococcidiopsis thermalis]|uniref:hypothetical protein n=1 Tax=Chroococcidiopsis thermalis TaxID=54299 RepID=UPI0015F0A9DB|nr:hypothetical protein [Chroococcidiopsis thermalis]